MIGVLDNDPVHLEDFVAYTQAGHICRATFGDARNEDAFIVALERRRAATAGYAQAETGRRSLDVNLQSFFFQSR